MQRTVSASHALRWLHLAVFDFRLIGDGNRLGSLPLIVKVLLFLLQLVNEGGQTAFFRTGESVFVAEI